MFKMNNSLLTFLTFSGIIIAIILLYRHLSTRSQPFADLGLLIGVLLAVLIGTFGIIIIFLIITGGIDLKYLISEKNGHASLSRFQFLIFTFVISLSLFLIIVGKSTPEFPDQIPAGILALLGISGGSYVIAKGIQHGSAQSDDSSPPGGNPPPPVG